MFEHGIKQNCIVKINCVVRYFARNGGRARAVMLKILVLKNITKIVLFFCNFKKICVKNTQSPLKIIVLKIQNLAKRRITF